MKKNIILILIITIILGIFPITAFATGDSAEINKNASMPTQFIDVPADAYYLEPVKWALESGITTGTSDTTFSPNEYCTRAQIVTFLYRAFN